MRTSTRRAAALGLSATAVCGPLAGPALAAPASLYAPSALVLTVGHGERAATTAPERAVTLVCAPKPSGTHPDAARACRELRAVDGDLTALATGRDVVCVKDYRPVVVTAQGVWQGERVAQERTFANACLKNAAAHGVLAF
ncbi:subtilase-type protease inhibitor [Streptomyces thermodiastaticus]